MSVRVDRIRFSKHGADRMFSRIFKYKSFVEATSIAGIVVLLFWTDQTFGVLDWITNELFSRYPGLEQYSVTLIVTGFVGLSVFSVIQRVRRNQERTARSKLEEYLRQRDFVDPITGLSNRLGLKLMLRELRNSETRTKISILTFEIRNLDSIKSVHGEKAAEFIETTYTELLRKLSRSDDFVAVAERGQFYMVVNSDEEDECRFQIDRAIDAVMGASKNGINVDELNLSTFVSFGLLELANHRKIAVDWDSEQCVQRVDYALQLAGTKGHEALETYSDVMECAIGQRALVEGELLDALTSGQIQPYFQPFIDMQTNRVVGLEVLARWEHPTYGGIPPSVFVPIAEDVGAMRALTLSMLKQACDKAISWPNSIKLSFNISPNELRDEATMDGFFEILKSAGIDTDRVEVEVTENAFVEEVGEVSDAVAKLKKRGISISIDDFGTGFANLKHLKLLPFDKIKIDQTFVRDMANNPESRAIVRNIIALGKSLGLPTIAEGIELGHNRDALQELGCSLGQGYLFAKALKPEEVLPFIRKYEQESITLERVA